MNILKEVTNIFLDIFDDNTLIITENTSSNDIDDWDSLAQINIIVACENKFNIKFDIKDISKFKNVGDLINIIKEKSI